MRLNCADYLRHLKDIGRRCTVKVSNSVTGMVRKPKTPKRGKHTPEQLRELILQAARELIEVGGLEGMSAREVARKVNYSPGTLYNVFKDRDEIILTLEARLLDRLQEDLKMVSVGTDARKTVIGLADAYVQFTRNNPRLWSMLFEHRLNNGKDAPEWYQQKIDGLMSCVEEALTPLMPDKKSADIARSARTLWAGVHGITSLASADKLSAVTNETSQALVDNLVRTYLDGLTAGQSS